MLVVTTDTLPGYQIRDVCGEVVGISARSNNPYLEGIKTLAGRRNPRHLQLLRRWREEAVEDMARAAVDRGANAVVGMRFDHRMLTSSWVELCAYGTAVVVALQVRGAGRRSA